MKVLIITTFFLPDSAISAVRPYMLAKYLAKDGNEVVVLRSGAFNAIPSENVNVDNEQFRVISFLGESADAEKYRRGEYQAIEKHDPHAYVPSKFRKCFAKTYHFVKEPIETIKRRRQAKYDYELQKKVLNSLKADGEQFDIVFSTYSKLENVFAGEYAAKLFGAKWIMDFRDPIVQHNGGINYTWNLSTYKIQLHALQTASFSTTVSEGLTRELHQFCPQARVETLYNGYDPDGAVSTIVKPMKTPLTMCYTGGIYRYRQEALEGFLDFLVSLLHNNIIDRAKLRFIYAGPNSDLIMSSFAERQIEDILDDRGYVSREEAKRIQDITDLFLVLSWNTKTSQGVLTGKFYEGIRAGKPILSVVAGNMPESELDILNRKYQYGFCFELCRKELQAQSLREFFMDAYIQKTANGVIAYQPIEELKDAFRYDQIAKRLQRLSEQIIDG